MGVQSPGRPPLVDAGDGRLDLVSVSHVLGQALPRRIGHGQEQHPPTEPRVGLEQLVEGPEAPQQVLGELHPVDPRDHQPVVAGDLLVELAAGCHRRCLVDLLSKPVGVGGER